MPFVRFETKNYQDRCNRMQTSRKIICTCDQCGKEFERGRTRHHTLEKCENQLWFCSRKCSTESRKTGGLLWKRTRQTFKDKYGSTSAFNDPAARKKADKTIKERYGGWGAASTVIREKINQTNNDRRGVDFPLQSAEVRDKIRETLIETRGVDHNWKDSSVQQSMRETWLENYGVDNPFKSPEIQARIIEVMIERYGVENAMQLQEIREKAKCATREKYGVNHPIQSPEIRDKMTNTMIERYGIEHALQSEELRNRAKATWFNNYGVEHPSKVPEICQKAHETMKKNGTYGKSQLEDQFYEKLCVWFGEVNVERQSIVNDLKIDFHIKSIDTYVQFDGEYWHGLDRPLQEIQESNGSRDRAILDGYLRDRKQDEWFKEHDLNLVRITDREFKNSDDNQLLERLQ